MTHTHTLYTFVQNNFFNLSTHSFKKIKTYVIRNPLEHLKCKKKNSNYPKPFEWCNSCVTIYKLFFLLFMCYYVFFYSSFLFLFFYICVIFICEEETENKKTTIIKDVQKVPRMWNIKKWYGFCEEKCTYVNLFFFLCVSLLWVENDMKMREIRWAKK